jgi:hypothetical protein
VAISSTGSPYRSWPLESAAKSSSESASSTRRFWSSPVSVLRVTFSVAGHGEVGHLAADLLDGAARLGLDVATGLLHHLLALAPGLREGLGLLVLRRPAGPGDDVVRLATGVGEPLAVLREELVGLPTRPLGGVDGVLDRALALVERLGDAREGHLAEDVDGDGEDQQRPDHQPSGGRDQEGAAAVLRREDDRVAHYRKKAIRPATRP